MLCTCLRLVATTRLLRANLVRLALLERLAAALARARHAVLAVLARLNGTRLERTALEDLRLRRGLARVERRTDTAHRVLLALRALAGRRAARRLGLTLALIRDHALDALLARTLLATRLDLTRLDILSLHLFSAGEKSKKCTFHITVTSALGRTTFLESHSHHDFLHLSIAFHR